MNVHHGDPAGKAGSGSIAAPARLVGDWKTPRDAALGLLAGGFWPVPIHPGKKRPLGDAWGATRATVDSIHRGFKRPGRGVGIVLGPGRGPGESWLIDIEGDGPQAEDSRVRLFGGEVIPSFGWTSARGSHVLLLVDPARVGSVLGDMTTLVVKGPGKGPGVYKLPDYPDLEIRIGGFHPDGTVKQFQSVIPPTPGTDGEPRTWNGVEVIAEAPAAFYEALRAAAVSTVDPVEPKPSARAEANGKARQSGRWTPEARALAYLAKAEPAISGSGGHNAAFKAAVAIGPGFGLDPDVAFRLLLTEYNPRCKPPWSEKELRHKVDDAYKVETRRGWLLEVERDGRSDSKAKPSGKVERNGQAKPSATVEGRAEGSVEGSDDSEPAKQAAKAFRNYRFKNDSQGKAQRVPLGIVEIAASMPSPGWPKRRGEELFVRSGEHKPVMIGSPQRLFAWINARCPIKWTKGGEFVPQERFYEHLRLTAEQYESIELAPHFPPVPGVFYMHPEIPPGRGSLDKLVSLFSPETDADSDLIRTAFLTPFWGGAAGRRPAFLLTSPDDDKDGGRGVGKSTLAQMVALLAGGKFEVSPTEDIGTIKTRMLSGSDREKRVALLDNLKTLRFSWSDLEGLLTADTISGRALYIGEGQRPNLMTWFVTLNGASLSKDMAQRVVVIRLKRPEFKAGWEEHVRSFIELHRWEIIGDIVATLATERKPLIARTRWSSWETGVLATVVDPAEAQKVIIERQGTIDDENSERDSVRDHFAKRLLDSDYDPEHDVVFIKSDVIARWWNEYQGGRADAPHVVSRRLGNLRIAELAKRNTEHARGWIWRPVCRAGQSVEPTLFYEKGEHHAPWGSESRRMGS